ncbi:polysaccharide deacetylase family protein [Gorillibacterium timonense]|uniref:polysaccharide deacetylase family protein n=1 Tax=Gorillibacterium timonense TaxID=1689269 RepID=UPI00071DE142|nr:polysaccharide deacetylase family protein [Gorillibacterium timonense]
MNIHKKGIISLTCLAGVLLIAAFVFFLTPPTPAHTAEIAKPSPAGVTVPIGNSPTAEPAYFASGQGKPTTVNSTAKVTYTNKVAVLMYHDFKDDPKAKSISLKVFQEQLTTLTKNGFHFISMDEFKAFKLNKGKVPANAVLLTFDDGYEDFYTVAYPYLKKNKIPATNFIIVRSTETGNPGGNPHLTWDQMREMGQNGMSFYSHTYNQHFYIPNAGPALTSRYPAEKGKPAETVEQYHKRITDDLALADKRIREELGTKTDVFSYPYGASNKDIRTISAKLGHKLDVTIQGGLNGPTGNMVYRINAGYKSISGKDLIAKIREYTK